MCFLAGRVSFLVRLYPLNICPRSLTIFISDDEEEDDEKNNVVERYVLSYLYLIFELLLRTIMISHKQDSTLLRHCSHYQSQIQCNDVAHILLYKRHQSTNCLYLITIQHTNMSSTSLEIFFKVGYSTCAQRNGRVRDTY